jgi:hypothetical protein
VNPIQNRFSGDAKNFSGRLFTAYDTALHMAFFGRFDEHESLIHTWNPNVDCKLSKTYFSPETVKLTFNTPHLH